MNVDTLTPSAQAVLHTQISRTDANLQTQAMKKHLGQYKCTKNGYTRNNI